VTSFLPDSSYMLAVVSAEHQHHAAALRELDGHLDRGEIMVVTAHALVETYSVLTRLPEPHRTPAASALEVIRAGFVRDRRYEDRVH